MKKGSNDILWEYISIVAKCDISEPVRLLVANPFLVLSQPPFSAQAVECESIKPESPKEGF